ncbi:hypothetical protein N339_02563, partial [Pterocles gutturalis]
GAALCCALGCRGRGCRRGPEQCHAVGFGGVVGLNGVPQGCQPWWHSGSHQLKDEAVILPGLISLPSLQHLQANQPLLQLTLAEALDGGGGLSWVPGDPHETAATGRPADLEDWDALGVVGQLAGVENAGVQESRGAPGPHAAWPSLHHGTDAHVHRPGLVGRPRHSKELEGVLRRGEVGEGERHLPAVQLLLREAPRRRLLVDLHLAEPRVPGDPVQGVACPQRCSSQEVMLGQGGPVPVLGHLQQHRAGSGAH